MYVCMYLCVYACRCVGAKRAYRRECVQACVCASVSSCERTYVHSQAGSQAMYIRWDSRYKNPTLYIVLKNSPVSLPRRLRLYVRELKVLSRQRLQLRCNA